MNRSIYLLFAFLFLIFTCEQVDRAKYASALLDGALCLAFLFCHRIEKFKEEQE